MNLKIHDNKLIILRKSRIQLIPLEHILFFERFGQKTYISLQECEFTIRNTLKQLEEILPSNFKRVHRSFIVNTNHILELKILNENTYEAFFPGDKHALVSKEIVNYIF
ncbi:LytTR family DNA-binding domain-containing protein [Geobacillus stearothermophilus]|uniref:LytTR family DNA-binding domain-containing protein n=1 Tax=Geobacillus stearothermophilus TaxID=1422 RepID=UPI00067A9E9A|nr:LytTR family DNA-binding domain-containing protein [Geobacillus stearothermophilus]MED4333567.1 LytTR family DNA-binding domain-containing protein [Geobacillus stearothermophilus]